MKHLLIAVLKKIIASIELQLLSWGGNKEEPITKDEIKAEGAFIIRAFESGKEVGFAKVYHEITGWYIYEVEVNNEYRRQGIATKIYDYADKVTGAKVMPQVLDPGVYDQGEIPTLSKNAFQLWKKRRPDLVDDILEVVNDEDRELFSKL